MGPMFLRTLLGTQTNYYYIVVEYNLTNGSWKQEEIKVDETKMRIEQDGQQFETNIRGWQLAPKNVWMQDYKTFLAIRKQRGYTGAFPKPIY